jgi:hypothetical protein
MNGGKRHLVYTPYLVPAGLNIPLRVSLLIRRQILQKDNTGKKKGLQVLQ